MAKQVLPAPSKRASRTNQGMDPAYIIPIGDFDAGDSAFEGDPSYDGDIESGSIGGHVELGDTEYGDSATIYRDGTDAPFLQREAQNQVAAMKRMPEDRKVKKLVPYIAVFNGLVKESPFGLVTRSFPYLTARQMCIDVRKTFSHKALPKTAAPLPSGVATVDFTFADLIGITELEVPFIEVTIRSPSIYTPAGVQIQINALFQARYSVAPESIGPIFLEWINTGAALTARIFFYRVTQTEPDPCCARISGPSSGLSVIVSLLNWPGATAQVTVPGTRLVSFMNFIEMR